MSDRLACETEIKITTQPPPGNDGVLKATPDSMSQSNLVLLTPIARAYALGYVTATGPRLFGFLRVVTRKDINLEQKLRLLATILRTSTQLNRFPTAGTLIVTGATILPRLILTILKWTSKVLKTPIARTSSQVEVLIRYITSFLSAWLAFDLLNRDDAWGRKRAASLAIRRSGVAVTDTRDPYQPLSGHQYRPSTLPQTPFAGKTLDFTLLALCRAVDTTVFSLWTSTKSSPNHPSKIVPRLASLTARLADPLIFATSAAIIMHAWFYTPERLPKTYNNWISRAADIDPGLTEALRHARQGIFLYGQDTGQADICKPLCHRHNYPEVWADPAKIVPVPCELVHSGTGRSCEYHAFTRFSKGWMFAMKVYVPLQLVTNFRVLASHNLTLRERLQSLLRILKSASTSSSFLAAFIALFYYTVCLVRTRTRILYDKQFPGHSLDVSELESPHMTPSQKKSYLSISQQIDSGLCVLAGCLTCGWSVLLEKPARRMELGGFVAPRALATLLPRVYDKKDQWKEKIVFAASVATVMSDVVANGGRNVRGVMGKILAGVVNG